MPKPLLQYNVTVNVACGSYAGAIVSGYTQDSATSTTGGILISGARSTSTLATGSATGTASSGTAGDDSITYGTLTDGTQTWTVNDLRGRYLRITGGTGSGQIVPIVSNTATVITVARVTWTAPTGTSTYVIEDACVIITSGVHGVAPATGTAVANSAGALFVALSGVRAFMRDVQINAGAVTNGVEVGTGAGTVTLQRVQVANGPTNASFWLSDVLPGGGFTMVDCTATTSSTLISHVSSFDNASKSTISLSGLVLNGGSIGIELGALTVSSSQNISIQNASTYGIKSYLDHMGDRWNGTQITCVDGTGVGFGLGAVFSTAFLVYGPSHSVVTAMKFTTCGTGFQVEGPGVGLDVTSVTGTVGTTGLDVRNGAFATVAGTGYALTAGTNDVNLDNGGLTTTMVGINTGECASTLGFGSAVCKR